MDVKPGERFGPYDIVSTLGAGGMGVVYRARDPRLGREVAIKTLPKTAAEDPARLKRFEQEAQAAGALHHPNVVTIYDVGQEAGTPYLVTELLEGQTLRERLREGPVPVRKAIEIAIQVARGLSAVHEQGIVHRDLKPDNIFVTSDGQVKILDFGISRAVEAAVPQGTLALTQSGAVMGTAGYMSPEQVRGRNADARSDIFALGAILYEMVTGAMAFPGETPVERGYAILNVEPPNLLAPGNAIPPALARVIGRCLEKKPEERFQLARDLSFSLEAITDGSGLTARLGSEPEKARAWLPWLGGIGTAALLLGLGLGWISSKGRWGAVASTQARGTRFSRVTFRNGFVSEARFAQAGNAVVFSGAFEGDPIQVFAGTFGSASTRPVTLPFTRLFDVSKSDEVALGTISGDPSIPSGGILSKVALVGGTPRQVLEHVISADYHADRDQMMVVRTTGTRYTIEFPPGQVILDSSDRLNLARFSPAGDLIAFERHPVDNDDRGHVEVVDLKGRLIARSPDAWSLEGLAWNPLTNEVWFTAADGAPERWLEAMSVAGKEREILRVPGILVVHDIDPLGRVLLAVNLSRGRMFGRVGDSEGERSIGWLDGSEPADLSSDGRTLLFIEGQGGGTSEIQTYLRSFDGSPPVLLAEGWGRALSPDKKWALVSPKAPFNTLNLVPTGPGEPRALAPGDFAAIETVRWFADGERIVISAKRADRHARLFIQTVSSGTNARDARPRPVNDEELRLFAPPSPDGSKLAAVTQDGYPVEVNVATGAVKRFPGLVRGDQPLQWSADGRELILVRRPKAMETFSFEILRYELQSGKAHNDFVGGPKDVVGLQAIRGGMVTPDCKHYVYTASQRLGDLYLVEGLK